MKRRTLKRLLILTLLVILLANTFVSAAGSSIIAPYYEGLYHTYSSLTISDIGLTECVGKASLKGGYSGEITVTLQQSSDRVTWTGIKDWTDSGLYALSVSENYFVATGYYYRLKITVKVYDGSSNLVETVPAYSSIKYY